MLFRAERTDARTLRQEERLDESGRERAARVERLDLTELREAQSHFDTGDDEGRRDAAALTVRPDVVVFDELIGAAQPRARPCSRIRPHVFERAVIENRRRVTAFEANALEGHVDVREAVMELGVVVAAGRARRTRLRRAARAVTRIAVTEFAVARTERQRDADARDDQFGLQAFPAL